MPGEGTLKTCGTPLLVTAVSDVIPRRVTKPPRMGLRNPVQLIVAVFGFAGTLVPELDAAGDRSEERRVGKECRSRWSPYH